MASLADISRHAGVSIATASRVLNGSIASGVGRDARARSGGGRGAGLPAERAGARAGQAHEPHRRRDRRATSSIRTSPRSRAGWRTWRREAGHLTMVCNADRRPAAELAHLGVLRDYHAAGVVFAGSGYEHAAEARGAARAGRRAAGGGSGRSSRSRRATSTARACSSTTARRPTTPPSTCSSLGHRRIAFVAGPPGLHTSAHRLEGFEAAIAAGGGEPVVVPGRVRVRGGRRAAAEAAARATCPTRSSASTTRWRSAC